MGIRHVLPAVAAVLLALPASVGAAESYPARPVKLIVQGAAGSGPDLLARVVAEQLSRTWKEAVVIHNQPGAGGLIAAQLAAAAPPDGHTLFVPTITTFVILPEMHDKLPFDLDRAFVPIGLLAQTPMMFAAAPSQDAASLDALATLARKQPGALFYAANNRGSLPHLAAELWRTKADVPLSFVPYAGFTAGLQDVIGGRVSMIVESVGAMAAAVKAGTVKPLAVGSAQRLASFPEVPTVAETVPGYAAVGWVALAAPSGTPEETIDGISVALNSALSDPELGRRYEGLGAVPRTMTPLQTGAFIRAEQELWRPVVRQIGLKAQ